MSIQHLIWDFNGTLLDDAGLCRSIINSMLLKRSCPSLSMEKYRDVFDFPVQNYYVKVGFDFEKESWERVAAEFIGAYQERVGSCALRSLVRETLSGLNQRGVSHSILSAMEHGSLVSVVESLGIGTRFKHVLGIDNHYAASKIGRGKELLQKINLPLSSVFLIGDTGHDAQVAKELGIGCVLLCGGHQSRNRLESHGFPVIDSLDQLGGFFV